MKVLLVTSVHEKDAVERYAKESHVETHVLALNVAIAAFLTPKTISEALKKTNLKGYDLILTPGLICCDTSTISKALSVPAFKGPRYDADLPIVLDSLGQVKLSTVVPADDLLREKLHEKALREIRTAEQNRVELLKMPGSMLIGDLAVGKAFPMRVLAEIVDAPLMDEVAIERLAKRHVKSGADIIDVGMIAGESQPSEAKRILALVKRAVKVPVSIDSLDAAEIREAVRAGADLVLSGDAGNIETIATYVSNVAVVVIPTNQQQGVFYKKAEERAAILELTIAKAKRLGISKCIADLILDPTDILESLMAFHLFAQRNPDVPLFVGVSNVTELIDADSVGVNALLARLSSEVGASILLATEKSDKAKGSVGEEATAAKMMFLAKKRGSVPKDLGMDLLLFKDKRNREEQYDKKLERKALVIDAEKSGAAKLDPSGAFKVILDRVGGYIVATHYSDQKKDKPDKIIKGKTAEAIYTEIVDLGLAVQPLHLAYLGSELAKAEIALRTGKEYIQDAAMFTK
ncbi:MAG: dihydropteroate synthase-like protein [Candidatus Bathyarchaeia archaeon]|jgi:dihydropteroate synthase-like protein